jgi:outer membrane protein assembly factor BamA
MSLAAEAHEDGTPPKAPPMEDAPNYDAKKAPEATPLPWEGPWIPARRKDQTQTTPGYILTPAAANIPGIGFAYGVLGSFFNVNETEVDVLGFRFWGDLAGQGAGVVDMFLVPQRPELLTLNLFWNDFEKAAIETHRRGIDSDRDERSIVELDGFAVTYAQLNLRLWERRLQFNVAGNTQSATLGRIRDKDGEVITESDGKTEKGFNRAFGAVLDLTDDKSDPRDGLSAEVYKYDRPDPGGDQPKFYTMDYNVLYYVPMARKNTLVFNVYRSDAIVERKGETDAATIRENLGFMCDVQTGEAAEECRRVEDQYVGETLAANKYGTASPIGGTQRLRSYVTNRFAAAHAFAFGTEFRWNLTEEFTPFNIFVAGGVRTGIQVAAFVEAGTVSDYESKLDENYKPSYGLGLRFILASGFVLRADVAAGDEGTQPTLIFQYPWAVF